MLTTGPGLAASSARAKYCNPQVQYGEGDGVFGNRVGVSCALATRITKILEHRRTNLPDGFRCKVMKNVKAGGDVPQSARATMDQYLALIERAQSGGPSRINGYITAGAGYDTNVNSGPEFDFRRAAGRASRDTITWRRR